MSIKIALAGNPNTGKTTLFNALTGANQFVGNWPGVTVEKKEGKLKKHKDVRIVDLPGIYSLSPYTLEEVVARNFLIDEKPDAILNIIDGSNLERNLYLTTQLVELGIPVVIAINMMDLVKRNGDVINTDVLSKELGCPIVEISALKNQGISEVSDKIVEIANGKKIMEAKHRFEDRVENAIAEISNSVPGNFSDAEKKWFALKLFERDEKIQEKLGLDKAAIAGVEKVITDCEKALDDDSESIITGGRYDYISSIIGHCYTKNKKRALTTSDKIDKVVTNRWLGLPIFAAVMFIVYYVSISTVGTACTDWVNDNLFKDGWFLFGKGSAKYEEAKGDFEEATTRKEAFEEAAKEKGLDLEKAADLEKAKSLVATAEFRTEKGEIDKTEKVSFADYQKASKVEEPDPAEFGTYFRSIPDTVKGWLEKAKAADWLQGLILEGIIGGVGAVLGFLPQMLVLFLFLAFLEGCGYMARVAFVMDRIFRKFGLSGKSFIPMLIGTGCSVPGIMASRTIENERDRRMTIMTTSFMPCGAKLPVIALITGALFKGSAWVAPSAYFVGIAAIVISGIILKKTRMFSGEAAPFVMELPAYHWPTVGNVLRSMWERGWSFIKKAGTVILLATIFIWFGSNFGFTDGKFGMVESLNDSILAKIGNGIAWLFNPLGWGDWKAAVAAVTGLVAKENVVSTFGVLFAGEEVAENGWQIWTNMREAFTPLAAYSFLVFNLLCAPCFAAIGAIKREMNSAKWTWFALGYQTILAYVVSLCVYQFGRLFTGAKFSAWLIVACVIVACFIFLLFRPNKNELRKDR